MVPIEGTPRRNFLGRILGSAAVGLPFAGTRAVAAQAPAAADDWMKDAAGTPYTRNIFFRPTKDELHLLMAAMQTPTIPAFGEAMPALGIERLQKMGTKFLLCANALGGWRLELDARGTGKAADIEKELRANLLPGVTIVPAMVIAIEQGQAAGIRYNRQ